MSHAPATKNVLEEGKLTQVATVVKDAHEVLSRAGKLYAMGLTRNEPRDTSKGGE